MKRIRKQSILDNIILLQNANKHFINHLSQQDFVDMLMQCQDMAILIGNDLESYGDITNEMVHLLEDYCEYIYQISQNYENMEERKRQIKVVEKLLDKLKIQIENQLPKDRKEMVFLPYKVSMWDSLESVWLAADADPECDAYVIPIPYFDRNPDGTANQMHYDGEAFPDYVPITKYDAYDFENRRPDAVFIHNPYDQANLTTSVHPFFYSDNLKKYTDCLVYIPYFASAGGMSEGQALCPAYLFVDYIVIQSKKYRKFYSDTISDDKFLVMGSPKFDSILKKCENPPEIPEEWQEKIIKADGNKKKVFFYNTSIGGMLSDTEVFLKKMRYVFSCFDQNDDVCLLWRPHPLLEMTFDSMRPQYKTEYEALKNTYIDNKIGIYDATSSMDDSIALSDAYIGDDGTSVTSFFGIVGKPIFILDNSIFELPKENTKEYSIPYAVREDHNNQYMILYGKKLFFSINNDLHFRYLCDLPIEYSGVAYYQRAFAYKDKVFMVPLHAQDILVMDSKQKFHKIELKKELESPGAFGDFVHDKECPQYLFIMPQRYSSVVRLNLDTEEITYIKNIKEYDSGTEEKMDRAILDIEEVKAHNPGFCKQSQWMQYGCREDAFNTLPDMIRGKIAGGQFDKNLQIECFREINASPDGDCGQKIYEYIKKR